MKYTLTDLLEQFNTLKRDWLHCDSQFDITYLLGMRWVAKQILKAVDQFIAEYYNNYR